MWNENDNTNEIYASLPLESRCTHAHWKARIHGYMEIIDIFKKIDDEKSNEWSKYMNWICNMVIDPNSAAQERGLEAASIFMSKSVLSAKLAISVTNGIVIKCFGTTKQNVKELAVNLILVLIGDDKTDTVLEELIKGLDNKNPKIVSLTISTLRMALHKYDNRCVNTKLIEGKLQDILLHRDKTVRSESKQLAIEIFRWIGDAIKPHINNITPILQRELEYEFQKLRAEENFSITADISTVASKHNQKVPNIDASDNVSIKTDVSDVESNIALAPVYLLPNLPKGFYKQVADKKWSERKNGLEKLESLLLKHPILGEEDNYAELIITLRRIIGTDINVLVLSSAIKCLRLLIAILGKQFNNYAAGCMPVILLRLKDRKQIVLNELRATLDTIYPILNLETVYNFISDSFTCKNPHIAYETLKFFLRCLDRNIAKSLSIKMSTTIASVMVGIVEGSDLEAREVALKVIAHLILQTGEHFIAPFLVNMTEKRVLKIKEYRKQLKAKYDNSNKLNSLPLEYGIKPTSSTGDVNGVYMNTCETQGLAKEPGMKNANQTKTNKNSAELKTNQSIERINNIARIAKNYEDINEKCEYNDSISEDALKNEIQQKNLTLVNKHHEIPQADIEKLENDIHKLMTDSKTSPQDYNRVTKAFVNQIKSTSSADKLVNALQQCLGDEIKTDNCAKRVFVYVPTEYSPTDKTSDKMHIKKYKKVNSKINIESEIVEIEFFESENETTEKPKNDKSELNDSAIVKTKDSKCDDINKKLNTIQNTLNLIKTDLTIYNENPNILYTLEKNISDAVTLQNEGNASGVYNITSKIVEHECNMPGAMPDKKSSESNMSATYQSQNIYAKEDVPTHLTIKSCSPEEQRLPGGANTVYNAINTNSDEKQLKALRTQQKAKLIICSADILIGLSSIHPSKRMIALQGLSACMMKLDVKTPNLPQLIVRTISKIGPGLKDPDSDVLHYKLKVLCRMVARLQPPSQTILPVIRDVANLLTDESSNFVVCCLLSDFAECGNHEQIAIEVLENSVFTGNVYLQIKSVAWVQNSILKFGLELTRYKFIKQVHNLILSSNRTVQNDGIKLLGIISMYFNKDVLLYCLALEDLVLRRKITAEFDKIKATVPPNPIRGINNYLSDN